jgi:hypothetical protein
MKSKSVESEADLYVDGQLVSTGESVLYLSEGNGVFWPHDGKLLDAPYREASLNVAGMPDTVHIKDVHQCSGSPLHWEFLIA